MTNVEVSENPDKQRFELTVDGATAGFAAYRTRDGVVTITHTEINDAFQGRGLGAHLVVGTLNNLRTQNARVIPQCPFFAAYVKTHHDWDDILTTP